MNITDLTKILINAGIEENEAKVELNMLAEHFCSYTNSDRLRGETLSDEQLTVLKEKVIKRAETRMPVQYIIGYAWFMGEKYKVNNNVLIPRDETEILVRIAIDKINGHGLKHVLDIGTGSGCIACTIAKKTDAIVLGTDISSDALRVALDNVTSLGINNRAVFRKSDIFSAIRDDEKFDVIISNPPYIPYGADLQPEVLYEPQCALFADEDGLKFYRLIIEKASKFLNAGGYLMFELGIGEADKVKKMMEIYFNEIEIIQDLASIDRVILGRIKGQN